MNSIEAFLQAGGSVCPYAAGSRRIHVAADGPPFDRKRLIDAAAQFAATRNKQPYGALIVRGSTKEFEATKTWARELFLELVVCFDAIGAWAASDADTVRYVNKHVRPMLFDDAEAIRPALSCDNFPLYTICMAPVYPATHPRYAPQAVVVSTWQADVATGSVEPAFSRIRAAMRREHGSVYDADELMLPLPGGPR